VRALPIVAAACVLVAVGCGSGPTEEAAPPASTTTEVEQPSAADRPPAPALQGTSLDGERITLAAYRGRAVLINVWSSW
jgi:hypothetical protein